jgi:hypothetical protein
MSLTFRIVIPLKHAPRTGVPGVVVRPSVFDALVPVPGFDSIVAVARGRKLVGWAWLQDAVGHETVQEARHGGVEFARWEEFAPS